MRRRAPRAAWSSWEKVKCKEFYYWRAACGLLLGWTGASVAQDIQAQVGRVLHAAARDPLYKTYRDIAKGMEIFARYHADTPDAALRFRLLPRQPGVDMNGIVVKLVSAHLK